MIFLDLKIKILLAHALNQIIIAFRLENQLTKKLKMASNSPAPRTFGEKPKSFQIEEGGEYYYIGSEVCYLCGHGLIIKYE